MATRNFCPRSNEEGNLGTTLKNWLKGWFKDIFVSNEITDGVNTATVANIKDSVDKKHSQNTDTDLDATFEATFVKKVDNANVLADITSPGADIEDAVTKKHTQGTDQKLDDGGVNEVTAANAKDAVDKKHTQGSDTELGAQSENLDMNTHKIVGVVDPTSNQEVATKKYVDDNTGGGDIGDLDDVNFDSGTPTDDQILTYDNASSKWKSEDPAGATGARGTFTNASLAAGVLTITHSKGLTTPFTLNLTITDNDQEIIIPDEVTFLTNTITVDLSSYGTLTGTWGYYYI